MTAAVLALALGVFTQFFARPTVVDYAPPSRPSVPSPNNSSSPPSSEPPSQRLTPEAKSLLMQAFQLGQQKQFDAALDKVNATFQVAPENATVYTLRGNIYLEKKQWDHAREDYETALRLDPNIGGAKFNLVEIKLRQKKYDEARAGFLAIEKDPVAGDLATYKVFVCDLFGGHEDLAAQELATFNEVEANASYYFANATWAIYHKKTEEARNWLASAVKIYPRDKFGIYSATLYNLGYLPLPPPP